MFELKTKELKISKELKKKIEMICKFACVKYELINGDIISVNNTNLAFVKPHILRVGIITLDVSKIKETFTPSVLEFINKLSEDYIKNLRKKISQIIF